MVSLVAYGAAVGIAHVIDQRVGARTARPLIAITASASAVYGWGGFARLVSSPEYPSLSGPQTLYWIAGLSAALAVMLLGAFITALRPRRRLGAVLLVAGLVPPLVVSLVSFGLVAILVPSVFLAVIAAYLAARLMVEPHSAEERR